MWTSSSEESLGELDLFSLEQRWFWGILGGAQSAYRRGLQKDEPDPSQQCRAGGSVTMNIK